EMAALKVLHSAEVKQRHVTGLLYFNPGKPTLDETLNLVETPLAELPDERLRPSPESLEELLAGFRG
ncbi:MAG: 2-oxoacid:ferredoxin oxidoreductase subunit beta, partial [Candidatus Poseidoniia archaeon]|nr:2-oxoacid:ferredoxin oxidoreductase subunit beta [Candidatus Poseidoniia archaeon]